MSFATRTPRAKIFAKFARSPLKSRRKSCSTRPESGRKCPKEARVNFFRVKSALIAGVQAIPVQIESAQSRRLPYLQILGGSGKAAAELRERVVAAIFSSGLRVPARRITVQIQPGAHGLALEHLDLAVALAILGGSGQFPAPRVENLLICGALGLDGSLRPAGNRAALRRLLSEGGYSSAILPWEGSEVLSSSQLGAGGGFHTLFEAVEFLRGKGAGAQIGPRQEGEAPPPSRVFERIRGQAVAKRMLEVAAAGHHHALLSGPPGTGPELLAHALSALLPPLGASEEEEVRSIYSLAGIEQPPSRPFHALGSAPALPALLPDPALGRISGALLAHRGVLYLENVVEQDARVFPGLSALMKLGGFELSLASHRSFVPADPVVLAHSRLCACGGVGSARLACVCRPTEARRYRERWRRMLAFPFDLCLRLEEERADAPGEGLEPRASRVLEARARMLARQGRPNGRLSEAEALAAGRWSPGALSLLSAWQARERGRELASLLRVGLTVCDLRAGARAEERDLLEARHYFEGAEGAVVPPGRRLSIPSVPETNSMPIP